MCSPGSHAERQWVGSFLDLFQKWNGYFLSTFEKTHSSRSCSGRGIVTVRFRFSTFSRGRFDFPDAILAEGRFGMAPFSINQSSNLDQI